MEVSARCRGKILYLKLSGEIDEHNAARARLSADRFVDDYADSERAVVDLSEVSFMDSTGIGFLIGRYKKMRECNKPIFITNPSRNAERIFKMSGLYEIMPKII